MKYSIDKQEKYAVFTLHEDNLNSILAPMLKTEFKVLNEEGLPNFILDLSDVKFVDSSGLSAILTAKRLWEDVGSFGLTGVNNSIVKKLIEKFIFLKSNSLSSAITTFFANFIKPICSS